MFSSEHVFRVRQLYKIILRMHRGLPADLQVLGNNYAREEFKRHKNCTLPEAQIFLQEWTEYAINLAKQLKPLEQMKIKKVGEYLDPNLLDYMTEDQLIQLYELHKVSAAQEKESINEKRPSGNNKENNS